MAGLQAEFCAELRTWLLSVRYWIFIKFQVSSFKFQLLRALPRRQGRGAAAGTEPDQVCGRGRIAGAEFRQRNEIRGGAERDGVARFVRVWRTSQRTHRHAARVRQEIVNVPMPARATPQMAGDALRHTALGRADVDIPTSGEVCAAHTNTDHTRRCHPQQQEIYAGGARHKQQGAASRALSDPQ